MKRFYHQEESDSLPELKADKEIVKKSVKDAKEQLDKIEIEKSHESETDNENNNESEEEEEELEVNGSKKDIEVSGSGIESDPENNQLIDRARGEGLVESSSEDDENSEDEDTIENLNTSGNLDEDDQEVNIVNETYIYIYLIIFFVTDPFSANHRIFTFAIFIFSDFL